MKKSRSSKEIFKLEKIVDDKHFVDKVTRTMLKSENPSCSEGSLKYEDEVSLGV